MCRFSHFDRRNRSKTSKYLSLIFVVSLIAHGSSQISTAIWLLVTNSYHCSFLQAYQAPIWLHLLSGTGGVLVSIFSISLTVCYRCTSFARYFIFGLCALIVLELSSVITSMVLTNVAQTRLSTNMEESYFKTKLVIGSGNISDGSSYIECWNIIQDKYDCCGFREYTDWCESKSNTTHCFIPNQDLVSSCKCRNKKKKDDACAVLNDQPLARHSCSDRVKKKLVSSFKLVIIMNIIFLLFQCVTYMIVSCIMFKMNCGSVVETYRQKTDETESKF